MTFSCFTSKLYRCAGWNATVHCLPPLTTPIECMIFGMSLKNMKASFRFTRFNDVTSFNSPSRRLGLPHGVPGETFHLLGVSLSKLQSDVLRLIHSHVMA